MDESRGKTMLQRRQYMQEDIRCIRYKLGWKPDVQDQHGSRVATPRFGLMPFGLPQVSTECAIIAAKTLPIAVPCFSMFL